MGLGLVKGLDMTSIEDAELRRSRRRVGFSSDASGEMMMGDGARLGVRCARGSSSSERRYISSIRFVMEVSGGISIVVNVDVVSRASESSETRMISSERPDQVFFTGQTSLDLRTRFL